MKNNDDSDKKRGCEKRPKRTSKETKNDKNKENDDVESDEKTTQR